MPFSTPAAIKLAGFKRALGRLVLARVALSMVLSAAPAFADPPATTLATLLDRAQIEDLLVDYYGHLGGNDRGFGSYYLDDGVLDVNGLVAQGEKPIEELYKKIAEGSPRLPGKFHMLLTNPSIVVNGDSATADVVWTGVVSENVKAAPRFVEQGREHDELVKRNGRWYFKRRVITSDGGLPAMFEKTYKAR
jgi:SnoaL-like domain